MIVIRIISGANLIPVWGRVRSWTRRPTPHAGTFAPTGQSDRISRKCTPPWSRLAGCTVPIKMTREQGSDGDTLTTPMRRALGDLTSRQAAAVRFENFNKKAHSGPVRCGL